MNFPSFKTGSVSVLEIVNPLNRHQVQTYIIPYSYALRWGIISWSWKGLNGDTIRALIIVIFFYSFNAKITSNKNGDRLGPLLHNLQTIGHIKLSLVIGQTETDLLFTVVGKCMIILFLSIAKIQAIKLNS